MHRTYSLRVGTTHFFQCLFFIRVANFCTFSSGSTYPLEASLKNGGSRDQPTTAALSLTPGKEDDGAVFRCEIWNRAMPEGTKLEATVTLGVNCKSSAYLLSPPPFRIPRYPSVTIWRYLCVATPVSPRKSDGFG